MDFNAIGSGNYWRDIIDFPWLYLPQDDYCDYEDDWVSEL